MRAKALLRSLTPTPLWNAAGAAKRRIVGPGTRSYSANGEDLIVLGWFRHYHCDLSQVRYVDIGAAHPVELSNTYLLHTLGARGILIEPDPVQAARLRATRPGDIVVNAGVAFDERREATLFRMTSRGFNSFVREQAERVVRASEQWGPEHRQRIVDEVTVPLLPINEVIAAHLPGDRVDFLSIDTEGADLAILRTLHLGLLRADPQIPAIVCIEASAPLDEMLSVLGSAGFEMMARSPDNWLFRRHRERLRAPR